MRCALAISLLLLCPLSFSARIHRSSSARHRFMHLYPCPSTGKKTGACPGWVIDHRVPLSCGGADAPSNMNWQSVADAKSKDRWERLLCRHVEPEPNDPSEPR